MGRGGVGVNLFVPPSLRASCARSIAIGYITSDFNTDNPIFCEIRKKLELVKINNLPFVKKNYKKNGSVNE